MERDRVQPISFRLNLYFNSHAHVERDLHISNVLTAHGYISTHTLTWSVTPETLYDETDWEEDFNSHAHVERDRSWKFWNVYYKQFQLTRSRGAWPNNATKSATNADFNSHAHVERDTWCCVYLVLAQRDADLFFYLMGIGLILFTVRSQIAWHFHANLLGICGSLGVRWSKY